LTLLFPTNFRFSCHWKQTRLTFIYMSDIPDLSTETWLVSVYITLWQFTRLKCGGNTNYKHSSKLSTEIS
jgi:hypothetical protein